MKEYEYDFVERTFYLTNERFVKWTQSSLDEEMSELNWFDRWLIYAQSMKINLNEVSHSHKTEYFKLDEKTNKKVRVDIVK